MHLHWTATQRSQVHYLSLETRKDELHDYAISRIGKLEIEVMKFGDIRSVDPEIVLFANPVGKIFAFHRFGADCEWHFGKYLFGEVEVREDVLPALLVRTFG